MATSKQTAASYFAWSLNMCLYAGATGFLVDLIPEDGCIREFGPDEETLLGQSLERMAANRFKGFGTVSRVQCGGHTTPEVFYYAVAHAVRSVESAVQAQKLREERETTSRMRMGGAAAPDADMTAKIEQQQQQSQSGAIDAGSVTNTPIRITFAPDTAGGAQSGPQMPMQNRPVSFLQQPPDQEKKDVGFSVIAPHVFIVQDLERAPARTLECLTEMLATRTISAPPGITVGALPDMIHLPPQFITVASSTRVPRSSTTTNFTTDPTEARLSDRLLNGFFLRIPIMLPRNPPVHSVAPPKLTQADLKAMMEAVPKVHVSQALLKYIRDSVSAVRSHPLIACGLPPRAADILGLAMRTHAVLRGSHFGIPEDVTSCVIEVLAHRVIVAPNDVLPTEFTEEHPVYLSRVIIAAAISALPIIR